ncbi:MAG: acyl--CoA ligase [Alphaproteobacteria bacterium]|nr:acyl--CoA ligase [Alphaproteobacteria bacterium]
MQARLADLENPFAGKTYAEALDLLEQRYGERPALIFKDRRYSFAEVRREVHRASRRLAGLGLAKGETIALWLPNRPEFLWYWLGAAQLGLIAVFLNTRLKQAEFMYQLGQSDSRALITAGSGAFRDFIGEVAAACPDLAGQRPGGLELAALPRLRHLISLDRLETGNTAVTDWSDPWQAEGEMPELEKDAGRPALIAYSSGTTALPKGAMLTHSVWRKAWDGGVRFDMRPDDVLFLCVPLFGVLGFLSGVLLFWTHGCPVVLEERFDATRCLDLLQRERCTFIHLLPVMIEQLLAHPDHPGADLGALRAGVVLSNDKAVMRRAVETLGIAGASSGYGMTESTGLVTRGWLHEPFEERLKSHGTPLPGCQIRIVDPDTGQDLPAGETGEIWIGGYSVMAGYYNKPEETARTITSDGWLRSGDAGYLNADGTLVFLQRLKDGYKHKGFNVSTLEIEAALLGHPAVAEAAVVSIPHDRDGETGIAFVIPKAGSPTSSGELLGYLKERLSSFKVPEEVILMPEFPRTGGTEKVQKYKLREIALARRRTSGQG